MPLRSTLFVSLFLLMAGCTRRPAPSTVRTVTAATTEPTDATTPGAVTDAGAVFDVIETGVPKLTACEAWAHCCAEVRATPGMETLRPSCVPMDHVNVLSEASQPLCWSGYEAFKLAAQGMRVPPACSLPSGAIEEPLPVLHSGKATEPGPCLRMKQCCLAVRLQSDPATRPLRASCETLGLMGPELEIPARLDEPSCAVSMHALRDVVTVTEAIPAACHAALGSTASPAPAAVTATGSGFACQRFRACCAALTTVPGLESIRPTCQAASDDEHFQESDCTTAFQSLRQAAATLSEMPVACMAH